jgi:inhibitor of cysteine peptidase
MGGIRVGSWSWRAPVVAGWLLLSVVGCEDDSPVAPTLVFGEEAEGQQVTMTVGQDLVLRLESNPSTGYGWEVAELDTSVVAQQGEPRFLPSSDLPGASGIETWRFRAVGRGRTDLRLVYRRSWETEPPLRELQLRLCVS